MAKSTKNKKDYSLWLKRQPLSPATKRAYTSRINRFQSFLDSSGEALDHLIKQKDNRELAFVLKNYKRHLKKKDKLSPASVNAHLTAIDHFLQFQGIRLPDIPRENLPQEAPRALTKEEQNRFLRSVAACKRSKDRAIALTLFYTGIRIGECAALDVEDIQVVGLKRQLIVRSGKGDKYREIPLNNDAAEALREWLSDRGTKYDESEVEEAVFLNPQGRRMTTAGIDLIVRKIGRLCGLELSAHILRHTLLTNLVRNKADLVLVAEIAGHSKLETTRRYSLPTKEDKEKALNDLL